MLEIEVKYRVAGFTAICRQLERLSAVKHIERHDADRYFNAPDRDFASTDEALRLRGIGSKNLITYKGPKIDKTTKTRVEIEAVLGDGADTADTMAHLLTHLGYREVATVHKDRTIYHLQRDGFELEICLDSVTAVGNFVEIEILADEDSMTAAKKVLADIAAALELGESERRSYLEMLLANS